MSSDWDVDMVVDGGGGVWRRKRRRGWRGKKMGVVWWGVRISNKDDNQTYCLTG